MKIHILGICGTFMAGIAQIAKQAGHTVVGSDLNMYPPMSTQLEKQGIKLFNGYNSHDIAKDTDCVIVGNVISRGNEAMEYVINNGLPYCSGPEWLFLNILKKKHVLAVSGTHGKTTTASMLTHILNYSGNDTGFLIGGVPENFGISARIGESPYFVIEADEYDSAFFDKRPKFVHYHPKTLVINNLEFDHADIYSDLESIKKQFHYLLRIVPGDGLIVYHGADENIKDVLSRGCWTKTDTFSCEKSAWQANLLNSDGSTFEIIHKDKSEGKVKWSLIGKHNVENALAAIAAANSVGVKVQDCIKALQEFKNVKRRLEVKAKVNGITIYDDFAHHPTAIDATLQGLRAKVGDDRIIAVLEFGSYTMREGVHKDADIIVCLRPKTFKLEGILASFTKTTFLFDDVKSLVQGLSQKIKTGDHVLVMSNTGFGGFHKLFLNEIDKRFCKV